MSGKGSKAGAADDDGFEPFVKPPYMRAVVTACGHGGIADDKSHAHTRKTTGKAKSALKKDGFGFFVFRVQGTTPCPGLAWSATGDAPSNFGQYNAEASLLLKPHGGGETPAHKMLERGNLEGLAGTIREKIQEIDTRSDVKYAESKEDEESHPSALFARSDYYKIFTPENPPPEDHRLIAAYRNPGELLRTSEASAAKLPRRPAIGGIDNIRFFSSYGLFCIDSTDDIDKSQWCLTSATVKTRKVNKTEYHSLEREELFNLFNKSNIEKVVNMIGWRNGFLLRKETKASVSYKPSVKPAWKSFHDNIDGPVQRYLHAAFHQEVSYHDIISIWKEGLKYDSVLVVDVACNSPSDLSDWDHSKQMIVRTVEHVIRDQPDRIDAGYENSDDESSSSASSSPHAKGGPASPSRAKSPSPPPPPPPSRAKSPSPPPPPPPSRAKTPPRSKSPSRAKSQSKSKKGGRTRLMNRSNSYQKTSKHLKITRNNNTRRKRYTRRR